MALELHTSYTDALWRPMTQYRTALAPMLIERGDGCFVWDTHGNRYLDAMSGLWCVNVGYGRRTIVEAAGEQMARLAYASPFRPAPVTLELAGTLARMLPGDLEHTYFTNSGSEAVETAIKIARQAQQQRFPGESRYKIIARYRAYHGWTLGSLSATGQIERKSRFEPLLGGFVHVSPPACEDCAVGAHERCTFDPIDEIERCIRYEGAHTIAAVLAEPIIGGGGVIEPPDDYFPRLRALCDRDGILLIADEVITGFGRTGAMFGCEHWPDGLPDIITLAKGLSSGYQPIGATAVSHRVFEQFYGDPGEHREFSQLSTFGGHPVAAAASLANIAIIEGENLVASSAAGGAWLRNEITGWRHPAIAQVRGRGLMIGVELARNGQRCSEADADRVIARTKENGVLIGRNAATVGGMGNVLTLAPPLSISDAELCALADALRVGLSVLEDR